jgi:hypothetical protein
MDDDVMHVADWDSAIDAENAVAQAVAPPAMPEAERLLIAAVEKARAAYAVGSNEMAKGAARPARAKEICAKLKDFFVSGWIGEVETQSSNSDGLGVLSIRIADGISIKTWNNKISDFENKTLIEPEDAVFKQAVALTKGRRVTFGGQFFRDPTDCIRESSLTLKGSLTQPEFIFRFSNLAPGWVAPISVADAAEVVDWNWRPEPAFAGTGAILWDVQLRNTTSQAIRAVTVKFFAYDANGNQLTTDEAWVISIPPGEARSGKGYADLHGTEATATIQVQRDVNFDSKEMAPFEQWVIDEQLATRRIDHFCRVEQAYKEKLAITEKSLKQRWPNDQDCRDGYRMQACLWSNASKAKPSEIAFMDSCKRIDMRPPQDPKTREALCQLAYPKTPMWKEAIAGAKRCMPLITPAIAPAYRSWSRGTFE